MLQNIILDIGNVICEWNPGKLGASVFNDPEKISEIIQDTAGHADWLALDRGTLELEEAIARAQQRSRFDPESVRKVYENLPRSLSEIVTTTAAMRRASAANVPMYILSNMHRHSWHYLEAHHECFALCTGVVVSCDTGHIKPEEGIYRYLFETFSLNPESCVFIDDMPENIEAAQALGMQGHVLENLDDGGPLIDKLVEQISGNVT